MLILMYNFDCNSATYLSLVEGIDYVGQRANLSFTRGDSRMCHTVDIIQDDVCEHSGPEDFFANLASVSSTLNINIVQDRTRVLIDDFNESECGELKWHANSVLYIRSFCNCSSDIRVGYERTVYTTTEGQRFVTLCAIIYAPSSGVAPRPFTISYNTADDTAGIHI